MSDRADAAGRPRGIDPRGPRFTAAVTAVLLFIAVFLGATTPLGATVADRAAEPAFLLMLLIAVLFLWGVLSPRTAPWGVLYRALLQPRLKPATECISLDFLWTKEKHLALDVLLQHLEQGVEAEGGTRTPTSYLTRPSNVRVYQFRHFGKFQNRSNINRT